MSDSSDTDHLPFWPEATRDSRNSPDEYAMEAATQILKLNVSVQLYITLELGLIYQNKSNTTNNLSNSYVHGTNYIGYIMPTQKYILPIILGTQDGTGRGSQSLIECPVVHSLCITATYRSF